MGNYCNIFTDHKNLKYIFTQSNLNMRQRRWTELINNYDLEGTITPKKPMLLRMLLAAKFTATI
jgi:hypothetical protein